MLVRGGNIGNVSGVMVFGVFFVFFGVIIGFFIGWGSVIFDLVRCLFVGFVVLIIIICYVSLWVVYNKY